MKGLFRLILFASSAIVLASCDEDTPEERDPWDKSTDRYHHGDSNENLRVDVTETSESEVHTAKSNVEREKQMIRGEIQNIEKNYDRLLREKKQRDLKKKKELKREKALKKKKELDKLRKLEKRKSAKKEKKGKKERPLTLKSGEAGLRSEPKIDVETKQQFQDATDEKDPLDDVDNSEDTRAFSSPQVQKKALNYETGFYPGALWQYPYPYFHPAYNCNEDSINCNPCAKVTGNLEAKPDQSVPLRKPKTKKKQLIPAHYYGPPSAGWGNFQPGKTGCGWGAPYWYKKHAVPLARQLIPAHYYGPPSAGWGNFQPGKTGCGWGAPYWYKKRHEIHRHGKQHHKSAARQLIPAHYYGPPSAVWGNFQPGKTGCGWGAPYWYKSNIPRKSKKPKSERASRKFAVTGQNLLGYGPPDQNMLGLGQPDQNMLGLGPPGQNMLGLGPPGQSMLGLGSTSQNMLGLGPSGQNMLGLGQSGQNMLGLGPPGQNMLGLGSPGQNILGLGQPGQNIFGVGQTGWNSGYGGGFGQGISRPRHGRPNHWGFGNARWNKGGKDNIDYKAWFGPNSFGTQGWGGRAWAGSMDMASQRVGTPALGFGNNVDSDMERIKPADLIAPGEFPSAPAEFPSAPVALANNKVHKGVMAHKVISQEGKHDSKSGKKLKAEEEEAESGVAKSIPSPDDEQSDEMAQDTLQVGTDEVNKLDDTNQLSDFTDNKGEMDQSITEVKDSAGGSAQTENEQILPENAETSTSGGASGKDQKVVPSATVAAQAPPSPHDPQSGSNMGMGSTSSAGGGSSTEVSSSAGGGGGSGTQVNVGVGKLKSDKARGKELTTIKLKENKVSGTKASSAQEELKAKVDELIQEAKATESSKLLKEEEEKQKMKEDAQEEAYSTVKSKAANTLAMIKEKATVKTNKREPEVEQKLKTVKTEAANEKPLTL